MRLGISAGASNVDRIVEQVQQAEADGFTSVWFPGAIAGEPLVAMALAGRATETIELGTSVLQTYPTHPVAMANRVAATVSAAGRGITLGVGPSHQPAIEGIYGVSYDHPGRHTEEYVTILAKLLEGKNVDFAGEDLAATAPAPNLASPVPLLLAALAPRLLRVAGEQAAGTILWMGNAQAVRSHVTPRISAAAQAAGRPAPRIVAGLPVAVCDDEAEGRDSANRQFAAYGQLPNYRRLLDHGNAPTPGDAAIVGDEDAVRSEIENLFAAGATDVWAAPFAVGDDRKASLSRTRSLLIELAAS